MSALFKNVCCSFIISLYFLTFCKGIFVKKENRLVSYYVGTRQNKSYVYSYIRQWQRILQIDKRTLIEIRVRDRRRKIAMFLEIQDISQINVIKGAQQHVLYA
jgi:hypothetical protein